MPILLFLATLPLLTALGHDIYFAYVNNKDFELSAAGFIWTKYHPESYQAVIDYLPLDQWEAINTFLTYETVVLAAIFAVICYTLIAIVVIIRNIGGQDTKVKKAATKKWKRPSTH